MMLHPTHLTKQKGLYRDMLTELWFKVNGAILGKLK